MSAETPEFGGGEVGVFGSEPLTSPPPKCCFLCSGRLCFSPPALYPTGFHTAPASILREFFPPRERLAASQLCVAAPYLRGCAALDII